MHLPHPLRALGGALALLLAGPALVSAPAAVAAAPTSTAAAAPPATVSADVLPTVQVDGVVWDQAVVGDRVYVTGDFRTARPAGAAAGTRQTPRANLLAYDIRTGVLVDSWRPTLDAQGLAITASSDGRRIFVGGDFRRANGVPRSRLAAFDAATGALVTGFSADANSRVNALAVSGTTLYAGGDFTTVRSLARTRLAALSSATGAPTAWAPRADREVKAVVVPAGSGRVVVGGRFERLNGVVNRGMGALAASSGAVLPWAANRTIQNYGPDSAIWSLSSDGAQVYGTGYDYYGPSDFENSFAARVSDGALRWVNGCLGDTYASQPVGGVLYTVGHAHDCSSMGGHPQTKPETYQRALATTTAARGAVRSGVFAGQPAPALLHWLPTIALGTYTKQYQGAWDVAGDSRYVVVAGEFPRVNGVAQQGLARFTTKERAPADEGPQGYPELTPTVVDLAPGVTRVSWTAAWDRDDAELTYEVLRGASTSRATVVGRVSAASSWWSRPTMSVVDEEVPPGSSQTYRVRVTDASGNAVPSARADVGVAAGEARPVGRYAGLVRSDGAVHHWRLGEPSGRTARDWSGADDLALAASAVRGAPGALGEGDAATRFTGASGVPASTSRAVAGPQVFSLEAWFSTTSTTGGKVVGFGSSRTGASTQLDRHVYLDGQGRLTFGVYPGARRTITSAAGLNDGAWHHVVATLGPTGQTLWVDGTRIGTDPGTTSAQAYSGYWRVGGDALGSWPRQGSTANIAGVVDEVAVYDTALSGEQVRAHLDAGRGVFPNAAPAASFTASAEDLASSFDASASTDADGEVAAIAWDFGDGTTGSGVRPTHDYASAGEYEVTLVVTDDDGATDSVVRSVVVTAPVPNEPPEARLTTEARDLELAVDAASSTDEDGSVATYRWRFGDGGTAEGRTAAHVYARAGRYDVTLVVTDDDGATAEQVRSVDVQAAPDGRAVARDAFSRTVDDGLGTADAGGSWVTSGRGGYAVADGAARLAVDAPGSSRSAYLDDVAVTDVDLRASLRLEGAPTGGGAYVSVVGRRVAPDADYRLKLQHVADGRVVAHLVRATSEGEAVLTSAEVPGGPFASGDDLQVRLRVAGSAPTALSATVWRDGSPEPDGWLVSTTDDTPSLQEPGSVGAVLYLSGSSTTTPTVLAVDDLVVRPASAGDAGDPAPEEDAPEEDAPEEDAPEEDAPEEDAPEEDAPEEDAPEEDAPEEGAPEEDVPEGAASDAFDRDVDGGLGDADAGGAWTRTAGPDESFSVADGRGRLEVESPGRSRGAAMLGVAETDVDVRAVVGMEGHESGGGAYVSVVGRRVDQGEDYRLKLQLVADGRVVAHLVRTTGGTEATLASAPVDGVSSLSDDLEVRLQVTGTSGTELRAKVWQAAAAEPEAWAVEASDPTPALQRAGAVGLAVYLSGSSTTAPATLSVDDLVVTMTGSA